MAVEQIDTGRAVAAPSAPAAPGDVPGPPAVADGELADDIRELSALRAALLDAEATWEGRLQTVPEWHRASARNLVHYLALRQRDVRALQDRLAARGLSSLGRAECHVLATVDAVLGALHRLAGLAWEPPAENGIGYAAGEDLLRRHAAALLGPPPEGRTARVAVTAPDAAAADDALLRDLLAAGMDCLRIDCARGEPAAWASTIARLRRAEAEAGRPCRVLLDLAGPPLLTGPLEPGPAVVKWRPRRAVEGFVIAPARRCRPRSRRTPRCPSRTPGWPPSSAAPSCASSTPGGPAARWRSRRWPRVGAGPAARARRTCGRGRVWRCGAATGATGGPGSGRCRPRSGRSCCGPEIRCC